MAQPLPRFLDRDLMLREQAATLTRILLEVGEAAPPSQSAGVTSGGDPERLRGVPAIGRGVSGASDGSDPVRALLAKERRRRR